MAVLQDVDGSEANRHLYSSMIAVHSPEYFPRLGFMALVQHVDHFILADTFPYREQTFHDRTKLREAEGWHWITIPVYGNRDGAPIHAVEVETGGRWREKHWRSFLYDYRTTMYFDHLKRSFRPFFEESWSCLGTCVCRSVELVAELYELRTSVRRASSLPGEPSGLPSILDVTGAETVVLPRSWEGEIQLSGLDVRFFSYDHPRYRQNFEGFEPGMTAADLVFNYGPEARRILASGVAVAPATSSD